MYISPKLIEMSLGISLALMISMIGFNFLYLMRKRQELGNSAEVYYASKAAIATMFTFGGFFLRSAPIFVLRHAQSHGFEINRLPSVILATQVIIVVGTAMFVIGGCCWMRLISPLKPAWLIYAITAVCILFGIGVSL